MKIGFSFWKRHTHLHVGNLIALLATGLAQVIVLHLLINHPSDTRTGLIVRGIFLIILPFLATYFASRMAAFATNKLQIRLVTNLSNSPTNDIEQLHAHTFGKAATVDVDHLYHFWRELFTNVGFSFPVLLYLTTVLLLRSQPLAVVGSAGLLITLASITYKLTKRLRSKQREHHQAYADLQDRLLNYVNNVFQFRLYGSEKTYLQSLHQNLDHFSKLTARLSQNRQLQTTYISSVLLLILWGGLWFIQNNRSISPSDVAIITLIFLEIRRIGTEVFNTIQSYQRAQESAKTLSQWLPMDTPDERPDPKLFSIEPIHIDNLIFQYKNSTQTILYPDITIQPGERVWLKGPNGRGKSTLWKILTGLYTNTKTTIYLNHSPSHSDGLTPFFKHMAAVTEPARCYSGTLWEIIGNFSAQRESVVNWLIDHQLVDQFDSYPAKLDTYYDSAVNNLSAGQLKWLLLVQAFFSQPDFIILDEPFSSLDANRQQLTLDLIAQLATSVTLIVISHHPIAISFDKTISL